MSARRDYCGTAISSFNRREKFFMNIVPAKGRRGA